MNTKACLTIPNVAFLKNVSQIPFYAFYSHLGVLNSGGLPASSGETVSVLQDQSGNLRHATQAVDANRGVVNGAVTLNGRSAIRFGAGQSLATGSFSGFTPFTRFAVIEVYNVASGSLFHGSNGLNHALSRASNQLSSQNGLVILDPTPLTTGVGYVVAQTFDEASNGTLWVNGVQVASGPTGSGGLMSIEQIIGVFDFFADVGYDSAFPSPQVVAETDRLKALYGL